MNHEIELLRHDLFVQLEDCKVIAKNGRPPIWNLDGLETKLEEYLEALRHDRDELRNKLQAFEFANKSAGELLQVANAKVKAQRLSIGQLKNDRNNAIANEVRLKGKLQEARKELLELRKEKSATRTQSESGNAPCITCGGFGTVIQANPFPILPSKVRCPACTYVLEN